MKKEDLKPGDRIVIPYGYEWMEVKILQIQEGGILWQSMGGYIIDEHERLKEAVRYLADINGEEKAKGFKSAKLDKINEILNGK